MIKDTLLKLCSFIESTTNGIYQIIQPTRSESTVQSKSPGRTPNHRSMIS